MPSLSVSPLLYLALQGKPGKPSLEMRTDLLHLWREITRQDVSSLTKPFEQLWICNTYNPPSLQGNARFVQVFGQGSCGRSGGEQRPTAAFSLEEGEGCSTAPRAEHAAGGPRGRPCSTSSTPIGLGERSQHRAARLSGQPEQLLSLKPRQSQRLVLTPGFNATSLKGTNDP